MRLLSISSALPPYHVGGFDVGAKRASEALASRHGWEVYYLTSYLGVGRGLLPGERATYRILPLPGYDLQGATFKPHGDRRRTRKQRDVADVLMREVVAATRPQAILFWQVFAQYGMRTIDLAVEEKLKYLVYQSNIELNPYYAMTVRQMIMARGRPYRRDVETWIKMLLRGEWGERRMLDWSRVGFSCSRWLRDKYRAMCFPTESSPVIHWDIDPAATGQSGGHPGPLRCLWAGRMVPEKGLHIVLEAIAKLPAGTVELSVFGYAGFAGDDAYPQAQRRRGEAPELRQAVTFLPHVSPEELRRRMPGFDVFILSSIWEEPFSVGLLEAAAAGLALIATPTGGTAEAVVNENILFYPPTDVAALTEHLRALHEGRAFLARRQECARETAKRFSLDAMADRLHAALTAQS